VTAIVLSTLYYASAAWFNDSKANPKNIDKIIRTCARYVLSKGKHESTSHDISFNLKRLVAKYRVKYACLKLAYNMVHNECPHKFVGYLSIDDPNSISTRSMSRNY